MGVSQLFPAPVRRRLRRLRQDVIDVATAVSVPRRPVARIGALTDPGVYDHGRSSPPRPTSFQPRQSSGEATVYFADHDAQIVVRAGQTILQAGLEAGLDLDFSCTVGGCAACALQLIDGEVVYDGPTCLSEAERDSGMCLACVGRPNGAIVVETLE
ncbi:MAG: 2Fe-2S iron-sulfur cluster-binding protein [Persicimonas sp.]